MTEDTKNISAKFLETLKIPSEDKDWILSEQERIRQAERKKPTHQEIFKRMRAAYEQGNRGHCEGGSTGHEDDSRRRQSVEEALGVGSHDAEAQ